MAFTAKIISIVPANDGNNGVAYQTQVDFADSASGFSATKIYLFPVNTTQASAVTTITNDGTVMKTALAGAGTLTSKIGSVITI